MSLSADMVGHIKKLDSSNSKATDVVERFKAEVQFAGMLAESRNGTAAWQGLIAGAVNSFAKDTARGVSPSTALAGAEKIMAPIARIAKQYTVHCIGHAHIDMDWVWGWPETVALTNDTFITVLKLMDEFPDFVFTQSQGAVYQLIKQFHPELFEKIRVRVDEGRWEVAAVNWVEGDKNMASGESLARHLLYTRRFMADNFGLTPGDVPIDWEPDTFGFAATIPGILVRGGVTGCLLSRPGLPAKPPVFWWEGPDGSRVLTVRSTADCYPFRMGTHLTKFLMAFAQESGLRDWAYLYGIGDHGGGPTRRDILLIRDMNSWPVYPNFRMVTAANYFKLMAKNGGKLPVVSGELNSEFTGCYTSQSLIKRANRYGENILLEAELFAALARKVVGTRYPQDMLRESWEKVLFAQFHDILPGSGVPETRLRNQGQFQDVCAAAGMVKTNALRALAAAVDTSFARGKAAALELPASLASTALGGGIGRGSGLGAVSSAAHVVDGPRPFILFNPTAWPRREIAQFTVWDTDTGVDRSDLAGKSFVVQTPGGKAVQAQKLGHGDYWGHKYVDLAFPAEAPAAGYRAYVVEEGTAITPAAVVGSEHPPRHEPFANRATGMDNEFLSVQFDELTGGIVRLTDKSTGVDVADSCRPMGILEYGIERPRGMTAWIPGSVYRKTIPLEVKSLARQNNGPYIISLESKIEFDQSKATIVYALKTGQPWVDVQIKINWFQRGSAETGTPFLRMLFPSSLRGTLLTTEVPYGAVTRPFNEGQEVPGLRWADMSGKSAKGKAAGFALLNDCKYGHSLEGSMMALTLIRASYDPDPLPEIGEHTIRLALVPHGRVLSKTELTQLGTAFNHPLVPVATDVHKGRLPAISPDLVGVSQKNVIISGVKKSEDGEDLIVRLFETAGRAVTTDVMISNMVAGEIKSVTEVDMMESPTLKNSARATRNGFSVRIPAHGIAGVRVCCASR